MTGQSGAGRIWNETMELMFNTDYNKKTPFDWDNTKEVLIENSIDFALLDDVVSEHRNILEDKTLIISPHDGDIILLESNTEIPLVSRENVDWYADGKFIGNGQKIYFKPIRTGNYSIKAIGELNKIEVITLRITAN